jgi:hypothetical protein
MERQEFLCEVFENFKFLQNYWNNYDPTWLKFGNVNIYNSECTTIEKAVSEFSLPHALSVSGELNWSPNLERNWGMFH